MGNLVWLQPNIAEMIGILSDPILIGIHELFSKLIFKLDIAVNKRNTIFKEMIDVLSELQIKTVSSAY